MEINIFQTDCFSSGVEQQRSEGWIYGPSRVVRVSERPHRTSEASAQWSRTADARHHRPEDRHLGSADCHMTGERAESFLSFNVNILCNLFNKHQNQQRDAFVWRWIYVSRELWDKLKISPFSLLLIFFFNSCFYNLYIKFLFWCVCNPDYSDTTLWETWQYLSFRTHSYQDRGLYSRLFAE